MNVKELEEMVNVILNCSYKLVEIDQRNQRDKRREAIKQETLPEAKEGEDTTPVGMVSENRKNKKQKALHENYNTKFYNGVISEVIRKNSVNDYPMIKIIVVLDNGTTVEKNLSFQNSGTLYHIVNDFMIPFGIKDFTSNTPVEQFMEFPYENFKGKRVKVSLHKKPYLGVKQIDKFAQASNVLDWDDCLE